MMEIILYSGFWFIIGAVVTIITADTIKLARRSRR